MVKAAASAAVLWLCTTGCELLVNDGTRSLAPADANGQEASLGASAPTLQSGFGAVDAANVDASDDVAFVVPQGVIAVDGASELPTVDATGADASTVAPGANAVVPDAKSDVPDVVDAASADASTRTADASSCSSLRSSCIDSTVSCVQGCAANGQACASQCSNHACEKQCTQEEANCRAACLQTCVSCVAAPPCSMTGTSECSTTASPQNQN